MIIVAPQSIELDTVYQRLPDEIKDTLPTSSGSHRRMNQTQQLLRVDPDLTVPLSVFSNPFTAPAVLIAKEFPLSYATSFTVAWLTRLSRIFSQSGLVYIEIPNPVLSQKRAKLSDDFIRESFPGARVERIDDWVSIGEIPNNFLPKSVLTTILDESVKLQLNFTKDESDNGGAYLGVENASERFLNYSLFGAWQNGFLVQQLIKSRPDGGDRALRICDMGGGSCFLATELALQGHHCTVIDRNEDYLSGSGRSITVACGVEDQIELVLGDFTSIADRNQKFDLVIFVGSLLYQPKQLRSDTLAKTHAAMKMDAQVFLRELPKDTSKEGQLDHEKKFSGVELVELVGEKYENLAFMNVFTGLPVELEQAAKSVMVLTATPKSQVGTD